MNGRCGDGYRPHISNDALNTLYASIIINSRDILLDGTDGLRSVLITSVVELKRTEQLIVLVIRLKWDARLALTSHPPFFRRRRFSRAPVDAKWETLASCRQVKVNPAAEKRKQLPIERGKFQCGRAHLPVYQGADVTKRMSELKRLFYVWFLGAKECRGLRGDEFVRPIVRYFQRKEEECEPSKVTLQISSKGIKLVADSLRHFVPSHAVTYVSQNPPPNDDIVSVILLLYNPITKCPVHLHSYRCDSVETADLLAEQLQLLVDLPENQRKIRDLEQRLQSQGLYPSAGQSQSRMLIKSCDTGLGGSSGDLLAGHSDTSSDDVANDIARSAADNQRPIPPLQADPSMSKPEQARIARLYDSLAAELRDKLGGVQSGKAGPLLLPPKDYEQDTGRQVKSTGVSTNNRSTRSGQIRAGPVQQTDNGSSSGLSSGIGSDLDDPVAERRANRDWARSMSCQQPDGRPFNRPQQRYSYHDSGSTNFLMHREPEVRRREPVMRQWSERRESSLMNRRSMSDLRRQEENSGGLLRRREESCRDVRTINADLNRPAFQSSSRVKEALSKFENRDESNKINSRSRSFRDEQTQGWSAMKYRRPPATNYQELDQRERFPGLDRDTARVLDASHGSMANLQQQQQQQQQRLQRHKSSEFVSMMKRSPAEPGVVVVEPTQKIGNRHFRAVRQPN